MRRVELWAAIVLLQAAALAAGCGGDDGVNAGQTAASPGQVLHQSLESREVAHHQAAVQATDPLVLRTETARYAADMDSVINGVMMATCGQTGSSGMMGMMVGEMDSMHVVMGEIRDSVHTHRARMDTLSTLVGMREECEQHYGAMMQMMDRIDGHMPGGGDQEPPPDDGHGRHHP
jgi:hypothetical protein